MCFQNQNNLPVTSTSIFNSTQCKRQRPSRGGVRKRRSIVTQIGHRPRPRTHSPRLPSTLITINVNNDTCNYGKPTVSTTNSNTFVDNTGYNTVIPMRPKCETEMKRKQNNINVDVCNSLHTEQKLDINDNLKVGVTNAQSRREKCESKDKARHPSSIKMMTINCRSLVSQDKKLQLEQLILTHDPDIILATETHLDATIDSKWIFPEQYLVPPPLRKDRKLYEGGVLIAIKNDIISVEIDADTDCEVLWTKIPLKEGNIYVGCFYRQPSSDEEKIDELYKSFKKLKTLNTQNIILTGDINLPDINWEDMTIRKNPQYSRKINEKMIDLVRDFNLIQLVKENTRKNNILDLIFTSKPDLASEPSVHPGMSDHSIVLCEVKAKLDKKPKQKRKILLYKKADQEAIRNDLRSSFAEFERKFSKQDVTTNWEDFKHILTTSIDRNIPSKTVNGKPHQPWITKEIKRLIRTKQRRYKRAKQFDKENHWKEYRDMRALIHKKIREEHNKFVKNMLEINSDTKEDLNQNRCIPKKFWKYIRSKRNEMTGISVLQRSDGTETTDPKEKANILNRQYESVFTKEDENQPVINKSPIACMSKIEISVNGVIKQLQDLDPNKATGPDGISPRILKDTAHESAPFLTKIFQQSLDLGCVPTDWKHANVSAIFKKGKRDQASNYRPVSLTSVACKVLEHIIFHHVMKHLEKNNVLADHQHGFRKHRSCETQLITTLETISRSFDDKLQVDMIVLDFSKAFDTVAHRRLLSKLNYSGISDIGHDPTCKNTSCQGECEQKLLKWFENWLCRRTQQVIVEGQSSDISEVISGVPQGTVLGPLCFLLYINDIGEGLSSGTHLRLFADDSLIFRTIAKEDDTRIIQKDLYALVEWTKKWQMKFHPSKCQVMTISRKRNPHLLDYGMQGQLLKRVGSIDYLGVHIQNDLKWDRHINNIVAKANRSIGFIKRNLNQCPQSIKSQAYISLVRPLLEYAQTTWDPHTKKQKDQIEKIQRRAARLITNLPNESGASEKALNLLQWEPLENRRKKARLQMMFRILNQCEVPITLPTYFVQQQRKYNTRNNHHKKISQPRTKTDVYKYSFFPRTICDWNNLPNTTINNTCPKTFRNTLFAEHA